MVKFIKENINIRKGRLNLEFLKKYYRYLGVETNFGGNMGSFRVIDNNNVGF